MPTDAGWVYHGGVVITKKGGLEAVIVRTTRSGAVERQVVGEFSCDTLDGNRMVGWARRFVPEYDLGGFRWYGHPDLLDIKDAEAMQIVSGLRKQGVRITGSDTLRPEAFVTRMADWFRKKELWVYTGCGQVITQIQRVSQSSGKVQDIFYLAQALLVVVGNVKLPVTKQVKVAEGQGYGKQIGVNKDFYLSLAN
jgi:hypothetical protein